MTPPDAARPLSILHTNMHLKWGGQPNRILITSIGLQRRGHRVWIAGPKGAMLVERARPHGLGTFEDIELRRGLRPLSMARDVRAFRGLLERERFDIVDTHGSQDTWAVTLAVETMAGPKPRLVRTRHNIFAVSKHPLNRWLYGRFEHVITISPQVIPLMDGLLPRDRFTPIYSAPDPDRFATPADRDAVRAELGYGAADEVIGVVARLAPEKGHEFLLRALPEIVARHPMAKLLFVGEGRSRPALEALAGELGVSDRVRMPGFRNDVPRMLAAMDVFCLPSTAGESLGTSILEAFLLEVPVVATNVGGVGESVRDRETGRLVPSHDAAALAGAIGEMLGNKAQAKSWAANGKARVEALFTPEHIAEQTEAVYRSVLARPAK